MPIFIFSAISQVPYLPEPLEHQILQHLQDSHQDPVKGTFIC